DTHLEDKIFYYENLTLYNAVQQLTLEKELNKNNDTSGKTLETIKNLLSFAETKQYLNFRPQDISLKNCKLLGLTENKSSLSQELNIKGILLNYIENKLKKLCEDIAKFYYVEEDSNPKLLFAKATKLDEKLNRRIEELRSFRINLVEDKNRLEEENLIKELNEIEFELSKYQAACEFDQIVQAYIEVNKEIERMVKAVKVKQVIYKLNEKERDKFQLIIEDLDENHLFVDSNKVDYIKTEVEKLLEENTYKSELLLPTNDK
ncbi:4314_t:CDS:2, partial [Diversispora eburnea]